MRRNIPPRAEDQEVCQRRSGCLRLRCQHAKDRRINVILRDRAHVDELLHRVLVRHITDACSAYGSKENSEMKESRYALSVPRDDIERRVFLLAYMQLPADPLINLLDTPAG